MVSLEQIQNESKVTMLAKGMVFDRITAFEPETFTYGGKPVPSAKITGVIRGQKTETEYHTTSNVIIEQLAKIFERLPSNESVDNVAVKETRSKQNKNQTYLELVPAPVAETA